MSRGIITWGTLITLLSAGLVVCSESAPGESTREDPTDLEEDLTDLSEDHIEENDLPPLDLKDDQDSLCTFDGELWESCELDCQCRDGLVCRGLPGKTSCSVACENNDDCATVQLPCDLPHCDLNIGACACICTGPEDCPGEECYSGYCVGCATSDMR